LGRRRQLAIEAGTQADIVRIYDSIFYEWGSAEYGGGYQIASLISGIYAAVALNAVSYCSISCAGNIVQVLPSAHPRARPIVKNQLEEAVNLYKFGLLYLFCSRFLLKSFIDSEFIWEQAMCNM
jgi:hypothetical protein